MEGAPVSLRRYARSRRERNLPIGTHVGVKKAIERGALLPPAVTASGQIVPGLADAQLAESHGVAAALGDEPTPSSTNGVLVERLSLAEVRRAREELRLRNEQLQYYRRAGELVEAAEVGKVLFASARSMRDAALGLPSRIVPELQGLSMHEQTLLLEGALREMLESLAEGAADGIAHCVEAEKERGATR